MSGKKGWPAKPGWTDKIWLKHWKVFEIGRETIDGCFGIRRSAMPTPSFLQASKIIGERIIRDRFELDNEASRAGRNPRLDLRFRMIDHEMDLEFVGRAQVRSTQSDCSTSC